MNDRSPSSKRSSDAILHPDAGNSSAARRLWAQGRGPSGAAGGRDPARRRTLHRPAGQEGPQRRQMGSVHQRGPEPPRTAAAAKRASERGGRAAAAETRVQPGAPRVPAGPATAAAPRQTGPGVHRGRPGPKGRHAPRHHTRRRGPFTLAFLL